MSGHHHAQKGLDSLKQLECLFKSLSSSMPFSILTRQNPRKSFYRGKNGAFIGENGALWGKNGGSYCEMDLLAKSRSFTKCFTDN